MRTVIQYTTPHGSAASFWGDGDVQSGKMSSASFKLRVFVTVEVNVESNDPAKDGEMMK